MLPQGSVLSGILTEEETEIFLSIIRNEEKSPRYKIWKSEEMQFYIKTSNAEMMERGPPEAAANFTLEIIENCQLSNRDQMEKPLQKHDCRTVSAVAAKEINLLKCRNTQIHGSRNDLTWGEKNITRMLHQTLCFLGGGLNKR